MKIGVDIMGGDFAPQSILEGALLSLMELKPEDRLLLIGDRKVIDAFLSERGVNDKRIEIVHTSEVIEMGDHPAKSFARKRDSSIFIGFELLRKGEIDGFAGAGNTGAMIVGASVTSKSVPGIIRPAIATTLPSTDGKGNVILDVGVNPDSRPDVLYQYAILGSLYAEYVLGFVNPRVGLLNIGKEESKGNLVTRSAHELMSGTADFNFVGNIEGNDLFSNEKVDVVVCDGFVGNVVIKQAEAMYTIARRRKINDDFMDKFNFEHYGGTPILGINDTVVIGHGISNDIAIMNMIKHTIGVVEAGLTDRIKKAIK